MRRGAPRELARRQRVARLVRELAREVAALAENPAAGDRTSGPLHRRRRRLRRRRSRRAAAPVVDRRSATSCRHRRKTPTASTLRTRLVPAPRRRPARESTNATLPTRFCRAARPAAAASFRMSSPPQSSLRPAPMSATRRARHWRSVNGVTKHLERFALKLAARQRARDFATRRGIESGYGGAGILEPRDDQKVRRCRRKWVVDAADRGRSHRSGHHSYYP